MKNLEKEVHQELAKLCTSKELFRVQQVDPLAPLVRVQIQWREKGLLQSNYIVLFDLLPRSIQGGRNGMCFARFWGMLLTASGSSRGWLRRSGQCWVTLMMRREGVRRLGSQVGFGSILIRRVHMNVFTSDIFGWFSFSHLDDWLRLSYLQGKIFQQLIIHRRNLLRNLEWNKV